MDIDSKKAKDMLGKYVLVGVNRLDENGCVVSTEQIHGEVIRISQEDGVIILRSDGGECNLPPLLDCYQKAEKGIYTLKSTKEKITNPDYVATFNVSETGPDE